MSEPLTGAAAAHKLLAAESANQVLKHQLRNIDQVLTAMVAGWRVDAAKLVNEDDLERLAKSSEWTEVTARQAKSAALLAAASELEAYVDTWAEP